MPAEERWRSDESTAAHFQNTITQKESKGVEEDARSKKPPEPTDRNQHCHPQIAHQWENLFVTQRYDHRSDTYICYSHLFAQMYPDSIKIPQDSPKIPQRFPKIPPTYEGVQLYIEL